MATDGVVERIRKLLRLTNGVGATGAEASGHCVPSHQARIQTSRANHSAGSGSARRPMQPLVRQL